MSITAYITVSDARAAVDWYVRVFGANPSVPPIVMDDGGVGHAEVVIGSSTLMLSEEYPSHGVQAPDPSRGNAVTLHIEVTDVDETLGRAVESGARCDRRPDDTPNGRIAVLHDPWGHRWMLNQRHASGAPANDMGAAPSNPGRQPFVPRHAIVTGASSGIGRATALALAERGMDIGITWYDNEAGAEEVAALVRDLGQRAITRRLDVTDLVPAAQGIDELASELGGLEVFVANAGAGAGGPLLDLRLADWRSTLATDLDGAFITLQAAARQMVSAGAPGRLVAVTSVHEHLPGVGSSAYAAAKAGLGALVKTAAIELAQHGITVNAVAPGEIATAMNALEGADAAGIARPGVPVGRPGDPAEVAAAIAFLCSADASYITGASLAVDGGMSLMGAQAAPRLLDDGWRPVTSMG